jgi:hypothetical protein
MRVQLGLSPSAGRENLSRQISYKMIPTARLHKTNIRSGRIKSFIPSAAAGFA